MRRLARAAFVAASLLASVACSRASESPSVPPAAAVAPPKGTLALGEPISARVVALAEIARSPARYEDQLIATTGKVKSVCQEMGCWMELEDDAGQAHVTMHGHAFFVPKTASGHIARVQARVLRDKSDRCDESPPPTHALTLVELDATGVEID